METFYRAFIIGLWAICSSSHAQNISTNQMAKLQGKKQVSYEDLAHENKGCPENSICSEASGKKMRRWEMFLKSINTSADHTKKIERYRKEHGLPITFLAKRDSSIGVDPIFFNSRCLQHNPKDDPKSKFYKGIQFFKNDPKTDSAILGPAKLYTETGSVEYSLPYEEAPIMIRKGRLIVPRDHENVYYHLSVGKGGNWKVVGPKEGLLAKAMLEIKDTECPKDDKDFLRNEALYLKTYCRKIWNADEQKVQTIKLAWACP